MGLLREPTEYVPARYYAITRIDFNANTGRVRIYADGYVSKEDSDADPMGDKRMDAWASVDIDAPNGLTLPQAYLAMKSQVRFVQAQDVFEEGQ